MAPSSLNQAPFEFIAGSIVFQNICKEDGICRSHSPKIGGLEKKEKMKEKMKEKKEKQDMVYLGRWQSIVVAIVVVVVEVVVVVVVFPIRDLLHDHWEIEPSK